tara:strand:+ start:1647 stop:2912 length:1266 start_codon:yes stop_codon:yes gene_type:complete
MNKFFSTALNKLKKLFSGRVIAVIDIGTDKVKTVVAKPSGDGFFEILGYGVAKSKGLRRGTVVDMEDLSKSVAISVSEAEKFSDTQIDSVVINISGDHLSSVNTKATLELASFPKEVTDEDRKKLESIIEQKVVGVERAIVHRVAYNYVLDGESIVNNPVGMLASTMSANIHLLVGRLGAIDALIRSVEAAGIKVKDVVFDAWASSMSALSYTERRMGAILVDIGDSKTDVAVIKEGNLIYSCVIPIGGVNFTNDIASVLNLDFKTAEHLKKNLPNLMESSKQDSIEVKTFDSDEVVRVSLTYLRSIVEARVSELIDMMLSSTSIYKFIPFVNTVVITGGSAKVWGLKHMLGKSLNLHVRYGVPSVDSELPEELKNEDASTVVGLVCYSLISGKKNRSLENRMTLASIFDRIRELFDRYLG